MVGRLLSKWDCQSNKFRMFIVLLVTIGLSGVLVGVSLTRISYIEQMDALKLAHEKEVSSLNRTIELLVKTLAEDKKPTYRMPYFGQKQ